MQTVNYTLVVPKETKEVIDALAAVYEYIKSKKPLSQIGDLFSVLSAAVAGVDQLGEEMKSQYRDEAAGYLVHQLLGRMMPVKQEEIAVDAPAEEVSSSEG